MGQRGSRPIKFKNNGTTNSRYFFALSLGSLMKAVESTPNRLQQFKQNAGNILKSEDEF